MVDGTRKQKSHMLCCKDRNAGCGAPTAKKVRELCEDFMRTVNTEQPQVKSLTVVEFWDTVYLPFITTNLKPSTVQGYTQIWNQHLKTHFAQQLLSNYKTSVFSLLITQLAKRLRPRTVQHVKFLASALFAHAVAIGSCETNPIRDAMVLGKTLPNGETESYTLEEIENVISALVDHPMCQLIMALSYFAGLRKGEIAGLQWGDIDDHAIHVRRACVRGHIVTPKTLKSAAPVPLIAPVRLFLGLWRGKSTSALWVFPNERGNPLDLKDVAVRTIRPCLVEAGLPWKGYHAGRRGVGTMLRALTGNSNAGRDVLRHSTTQVTQQHYESAMPEEALKGMRLLEEKVKSAL